MAERLEPSEPKSKWNVAYEYMKKVDELFDQASAMRRMCAYNEGDSDALNRYWIFVYHTVFPKLKPKMPPTVLEDFNKKWNKVSKTRFFDITQFHDELYAFFERGGFLGTDEEDPYTRMDRMDGTK